jgi:hypothetical protein
MHEMGCGKLTYKDPGQEQERLLVLWYLSLAALSFLFIRIQTVRTGPSLCSTALRHNYWHSAELAEIIAMIMMMMTVVPVSAQVPVHTQAVTVLK